MKCKQCDNPATHILVPYEPPYTILEYVCGNHLASFHPDVHFVPIDKSSLVSDYATLVYPHIEQLEYNRILELMPIVCVDVAIVYQNKVLLVERATPPAFLEWWLPGGRLFKNESLEDCAKRKALQEVGLDCTVGPLLHTQSTIFPKVHSVNFCYLLFSPTDEVVTDNTIEQHRWIALDEIRMELHPYVKACLNKITNI